MYNKSTALIFQTTFQQHRKRFGCVHAYLCTSCPTGAPERQSLPVDTSHSSMLYTIVVKRALRCLLNRREEADSSLLCCSCARANGPAIPTLRAVLLLLLHHRAPSTYTRYIISYVHVKSMPERGIIVQRKQTRECHAPGITLSVNVMTVLIVILTLN